MLVRLLRKKVPSDEGESPFWISFADMMTSLMTLFLVVMAAIVVKVHEESPDTIKAAEAARKKDIKIVMGMLKVQSEPFHKVFVDADNYKIDIGKLVNFESGDYRINEEASIFLRDYASILLNVKNTEEGRWIRRFVIEGYTDDDGNYMSNLDLSLKRGYNVICAIVEQRTPITVTDTLTSYTNQSTSASSSVSSPDTSQDISINVPHRITYKKVQNPLSSDQLNDVQSLFLVGGFSFNNLVSEGGGQQTNIAVNKAASRRVELRVDFWALGEEAANKRNKITKNIGECR